MNEAQLGFANTLVVELFRLNGRLLSAGDDLVADIGLTSARWQVLGAIALSEGELTVAQVARNMGLSRQAVQRLTNEMIASDLLISVDNPNHRRARLLRLTQGGQKTFATALGRWQRFVQDIEELVGINQLNCAIESLRQIRQYLELQVSDPARRLKPGAMPTRAAALASRD